MLIADDELMRMYMEVLKYDLKGSMELLKQLAREDDDNE